VDPDIVKEWVPIINDFLQQYTPQDIHSTDEMRIYYKKRTCGKVGEKEVAYSTPIWMVLIERNHF
jgi:hypothetical protein